MTIGRADSVLMMKRAIACLVPLCLFTACEAGSGDDDGDVTLADWCAVAERVEVGEGEFQTALEGDNDSVRAGLDAWQELLDEAVRSAPDEIRAEVKTTVDGVDQLAQALADADYDVEAVALDEDLTGLAADMQSATTKIKAYNEAECGIVTGQTAATTEPDSPSASPTVSTVDEMSADEVVYTGDADSDWCVAARELDLITNDIESALSQPEAATAFFGEVLPKYDAALTVAPAEIATQVAVAVDGFHQLDEAFAVADYDILDADLSVLNDASVAGANDTIDHYGEQVCGIAAGSSDQSSSADFDPSAGTITEQLVALLMQLGLTDVQATCFADNGDFTDPNLGADLDAMADLFELCGVDPTELTGPGE